MTAQQLKNSILQMAVQGELVPQDPNDEPASVLLERIRAEKEEMIKEGKIKKEKNPSIIFRGADNLFYEKFGNQEAVCIADEVPFDIPKSWEWVTLKQVAVTALGKTLNKSENTGKYYPYLCSINIYWDGVDLTTVKKARFEESELEKYRLKRGDLLVCEGGDIGRSTVWNLDEEMYYQNALHRIRFYGGILPEYFKLLLECYKGNGILDRYSKGETIKHLVQNAINSIYFPLPPIEEQQRIIREIEIIIPYIKKYGITEVELSTINTAFPDKLKRSILQMAVQGKLVPQDPSDEPASVLLEKICTEKEQLIKDGKIKRDKHESVIYKRDGSYYEKVDNEERGIDDEIPFEIPASWEWVRLTSIASVAGGKRIPVGQKLLMQDTGHVYIRVSDMKNHSVRMDSLMYLPTDLYPSLSKYIIKKEDLYITVAGTIGDVGKIPEELDGANLTENANRIIFRLINQEWLLQYLCSPPVQKQIANATTKVGQPKLAIKRIENFLIALPPLEEQSRIVERLSSLQWIISNIKAR